MIGASAILIVTFYVIFRMFKGVKRAPKPEEAKPAEGGEKPEEEEEW